MAKSVNKVILLGNLGRDAEVRSAQAGKSVASFSLACSRSVKRGDAWEDETEWVNCQMWEPGKLAEYLLKGARVYAEGRLHTRKYTAKDGSERSATEVVVSEVVLCGGNAGSGQSAPASGNPRAASKPQTGTQPALSEIDDSDVPF